jgi:hypothetical protein
MTDQVPIPVYLWWMLMALAICGLFAAALWFIRLAFNGSVIDKIAQANDLIKTVNSLPTNPNVPNPLVASWNARIPARADEVAKLGLRRCPLCGRMKAEHKCPQSSHAAGMGPYPPRIVEVDPMNPEPKTIQPILFADGFRVTVGDLHKLGLNPIINGDGRIVMLMTATGKHVQTVEEWCGLRHGARIS